MKKGAGNSYILCSMNLDGSEHEEEEIQEDAYSIVYTINRGKLYAEKDYQMERPRVLSVRPLDNLQEEFTLIEDETSTVSLRIYGERIYAFLIDLDARKMVIYREDEETGAFEEIVGNISYGGQYYTEDRLFQYAEGKGLISNTSHM